MVVIVWSLDLQLHVHSVSIHSNVVSSNAAQARCTRYNNTVVKFVSDLQQVGDFLLVLHQ